MATTPRRAREIARTREDILEAAARAFGRSGFKSATMQDIAKEAGYTAASLYSYFSSKEEIFRGLFERIRAEMETVIAKPMPAGLTFRQKFELLLRRQLEVAMRHGAVVKVFHFSGEALGCFGQDKDEGLSRVELMALDFENFFRAEASAEDLGGWDPSVASLACAGMAHAFFVRSLRQPASQVPAHDDRIGTFLDLFFDGIHGSRKRRESTP